jgi:hypothetical protein
LTLKLLIKTIRRKEKNPKEDKEAQEKEISMVRYISEVAMLLGSCSRKALKGDRGESREAAVSQ